MGARSSLEEDEIAVLPISIADVMTLTGRSSGAGG